MLLGLYRLRILCFKMSNNHDYAYNYTDKYKRSYMPSRNLIRDGFIFGLIVGAIIGLAFGCLVNIVDAKDNTDNLFNGACAIDSPIQEVNLIDDYNVWDKGFSVNIWQARQVSQTPVEDITWIRTLEYDSPALARQAIVERYAFATYQDPIHWLFKLENGKQIHLVIASNHYLMSRRSQFMLYVSTNWDLDQWGNPHPDCGYYLSNDLSLKQWFPETMANREVYIIWWLRDCSGFWCPDLNKNSGGWFD